MGVLRYRQRLRQRRHQIDAIELATFNNRRVSKKKKKTTSCFGMKINLSINAFLSYLIICIYLFSVCTSQGATDANDPSAPRRPREGGGGQRRLCLRRRRPRQSDHDDVRVIVAPTDDRQPEAADPLRSKFFNRVSPLNLYPL